ncbi:TPA: hypothetical protein QB445_001083, partial [Pasteurella multocida]|nr:hypothetical protein [Pasteurella multocida]HDR1589729.1 hypothetical protein [Pasteurella multocida]HDR1793833.1 hypothetical protein [Pasteurella multocida]
YVFDEKENRLIYITGDQTHHAKVLRNNSRVAGTIFVPTKFVPSLQGVQFTGRSSQLFSTQAEQARALYKTEYSHHLIDQLTVWQVELEYVRLVDNSLGLFSTIEWRKGQVAEETDHYA